MWVYMYVCICFIKNMIGKSGNMLITVVLYVQGCFYAAYYVTEWQPCSIYITNVVLQNIIHYKDTHRWNVMAGSDFLYPLSLHPNAAQLVGIFGCVGYTMGRNIHRGRVDTSYHTHSWTRTKNRISGDYWGIQGGRNPDLPPSPKWPFDSSLASPEPCPGDSTPPTSMAVPQSRRSSYSWF